MNMTYNNKVTINADIQDVWAAVNQNNFVQDFLPEVKKDITGMGEYVQRTHRNQKAIMPAYVVDGQAIGWDKDCGTRIELPRQDTPANIQNVDIELTEKAGGTEVKIEVNYNPELGKNAFETRRCLKGIFNMKLAALKADLNEEVHTGLVPAFA